jgi:hypothetical protein
LHVETEAVCSGLATSGLAFAFIHSIKENQTKRNKFKLSSGEQFPTVPMQDHLIDPLAGKYGRCGNNPDGWKTRKGPLRFVDSSLVPR